MQRCVSVLTALGLLLSFGPLDVNPDALANPLLGPFIPLDIGLVGPSGEVILYYRDGNQIVVQECQPYTVLENRSDCETRPGTQIARIAINEFKNQLKQALRLSTFPDASLDASNRQLLDRYRQAGAPDLEQRRATLRRRQRGFGRSCKPTASRTPNLASAKGWPNFSES